MISFATERDKNRIIELWMASFGDSRESVELFLEHFPCNKALGYYVDGELVSFMFLPELELVYMGYSHKANYVYALCTDSAFRSRGIGTRLIEYSMDYSRKNNIPYTLIRPSTASLFDYYYARGFEREYRRIKKNLTINDLLLYNRQDNDQVACAQWGSDGLSYSYACEIDDKGYMPCMDAEKGERYLMLRRNCDGAELFENVYMGLTFE
ncbi:MAG: GNAT family N-acetyltransferase, partial [Clostridia bacterium]|nr:GNAT family N-acetyltransferase [Clostridia bacterium]